MDMVEAGELCPPLLAPLRSWSAPSHGHDGFAQCAVEMADSPAVLGLACCRGDMDTRGAGARGVAGAAAWRTCPETCPLSMRNSGLPRTLPPKQRHRDASARG